MRPRYLLLVVALAGACTEPPQPERSDSEAVGEARPLDGFLNYLPPEVSLTFRLPSFDEVEARRETYAGLLKNLGLDQRDPHILMHGVPQPEGLDRAKAPGWVRSTRGVETLYLPATDKGLLNRALREHIGALDFREEGSWILLSDGGSGGGTAVGEPLPAGAFAFRVQYHALLAVFAQPGDRLELGVDAAGPDDLRFRGGLRSPEEGATRRAVAAANPVRETGLLDFIPSSLALRVETSLPPTILATFLTRRVSAHCGVAEGKDREILERFLREVLTGADPDAGLAFGLEFRDQETSLVAVGRVADGEASPILAKLMLGDRLSFGPLVIDPRETVKSLAGFGAWLVDPDPQPEGVPTSALNLLVGLAAGEDEPLPICFAEAEGWFFVGVGPRGDLLVRSTRQRLIRSGAARSPGSQALYDLRTTGAEDADYVLGVVFNGSGLEGLAGSDREDLAALLGFPAGAATPDALAIAGFKSDGAELDLLARLLY